MGSFGVAPPGDSGKYDVWPGTHGLMLRRPAARETGVAAMPPFEALSAVFGLIPHWARDAKLARHTYNARSETAHEKPSFRDAWRRAQHCIIAADAIFEPDWRSGRAVPTRIRRADGEPMGIAGLWSCWRNPAGSLVHSYAMLTIPAGDHVLMRCFHRPEDEKRMVVILPQTAFGDWLDAPPHRSREFLLPFAAEALVASASQAVTTTAEGIEDEATVLQPAALGWLQGQGCLFSRPPGSPVPERQDLLAGGVPPEPPVPAPPPAPPSA